MKTHSRQNSPIYFSGSFESVNKTDGVIKGIVIAQEGEAKGHGLFLNKRFISDVVNQGKAFGDVGVKSRFGHPNMCSNSLGTYLGRYKNFRIRKNQRYQAIADLYLDSTAKNTPNGDLFNYVTDLADSAPDHFGNSIVFESGDSIMRKEKDEFGNEFVKEYATLKKLYESDLVDSPAATDGLFSSMDGSELAYQVTTFLDMNPRIFDLLADNPGVIDEFLIKYKSYKKLQMKDQNNVEATEKLSKIEVAIQELKKFFGIGIEKEAETELEKLDIITCPVCGYEIDTEVVVADENGNYKCPECGAIVNPDGEEVVVESVEEEVVVESESNHEVVDQLESIKSELSELQGKYDEVVTQLDSAKNQIETMKSELDQFNQKKEELAKIETELKELQSKYKVPEKDSATMKVVESEEDKNEVINKIKEQSKFGKKIKK